MKAEMFPVVFLAVTTLLAGDHRVDLSFGGLQQSYILHVPPSAPANAPVVINLHGGRSNAEQHQRFSAMDSLADREHFIVVYPNGTGSERMRVGTDGTVIRTTGPSGGAGSGSVAAVRGGL